MKNKFVVVDLETTGHSPEDGDRIIEIGIVVIENNEIARTYSSLLNPGREIPPFITNLTNITNEDVKNSPSFSQVAKHIVEFFKDAYFVAHNVAFDLRFLNDELEGVNLPPLRNKTVDTVEVSRILFPQAGSYKLTDLASYLQISHKQPHRALEDALVTAKVLFKIQKRFLELPFETIEQLLKLEVYFHSDLRELLNTQYERLLFSHIEKDKYNVFHGIAFKKLPPIRKNHELFKASFKSFLQDIYEEAGGLEKSLKNYEYRAGQREISESVYASFLDQQHSFIEAGTGIGKTIAYLLPALYHAASTGERVVLSTYTTQLQSQLLNNEIPLLKEILAFPFSVAMLKGQRHYLSLERLAHELKEETLENNYDIALTKAMILVWITETETGDLDEIQLSKAGYYFFQQINTRAEGPINKNSPWFKYSYYIQAQKKAQSAHVVITNHALLCTDLYNDYKFLPAYKYALIDEAHHFEGTAIRQGALSLDNTLMNYSLNQLGRSDEDRLVANLLGDKGILSFDEEQWNILFDRVRININELFQAIIYDVKSKNKGAKSTSDTGRVQYRLKEQDKYRASWLGITEVALKVIALLKEMTIRLDSMIEAGSHKEGQVNQKDINFYIESLESYIRSLESFFQLKDLSERVKWIELESGDKVFLYEKPIYVADFLQDSFFNKKKSIVFTSATLTMRNSFSHIRNQLGLKEEEVLTKQIASPYNYNKQVLFTVPKDFPNIKEDEEEFIYASCEAISSIAKITEGKTLVLFTSYHMLRKSYYLLQETMDLDEYRLIAQGISSGSRMRLQKNFQSFDKAILLGTSSFWDGIDIPGEDLSSLIIVRLPFQAPNHPLFQARAKELEKSGKNPFYSLALPEAVLRFKQGFGRLIRSHEDRGIIFVCDSRLMTSSYRSFFTKSIPDLKVHYEDMTSIIKRIEKWF